MKHVSVGSVVEGTER